MCVYVCLQRARACVCVCQNLNSTHEAIELRTFAATLSERHPISAHCLNALSTFLYTNVYLSMHAKCICIYLYMHNV